MKTLEQMKDEFITEWIDSEWMEYTKNCFIYDLNALIEKAKEDERKMRKALEAIKNAFYTDGETDKEKIDDLQAIAYNVLYEIDNNL